MVFEDGNLGQSALYEAICEKLLAEVVPRSNLIDKSGLLGAPALGRVFKRLSEPDRSENRGINNTELRDRYLILVCLRLFVGTDHVMKDRRDDTKDLVVFILNQKESLYGGTHTWYLSALDKAELFRIKLNELKVKSPSQHS